MARALLFTAAAVAMIAVAFACPACTFMKIAGFDCGKKFDIPSAGKSFSKVCGGQQKIETACKANGACGLYTFGGDADCGYLKTAKPAVGGKIVVERDLTPSKSWSTYIPKEKVVYRNVPVPVPVPTPVYVERRVNVPVPVPVPTPVKVVERRWGATPPP
ncbi:MAG: hypothetical protein J3K34DRAFT_270496 [Monoraphidium minutum]|nr:MAG: hypothetical protein J3K34DRAFT_270496 [Monoraphidium minutum]